MYVARGGVVFQARPGRPSGRTAGRTSGRVDQLADRVDHLRMRDREPDRQPLMLYDLLKVYAADARVEHPRLARMTHAARHAMWQYGSSEKTIRPVPAHDVGDRGEVLRGGDPARGVVRRVQEDAGFGSSARNRPRPRAGGSHFRPERGETGLPPRRSMFGTYVGKCGLKTNTPSPGSSNASAKYCSNGFAPEADDDVLRPAPSPNSSRTNAAAAAAELRQARPGQ